MSKYNYIPSGMSEKEEVQCINWVMGAYCLLESADAKKLLAEYTEYREATLAKGEPIFTAWLYYKERIQVTVKEDSAQ